jgi:hypothetical protein
LVNTLVLASSINDLKLLKDLKKSTETKIYSFNIHVHKSLDREQILHEIAENYLSNADRLKVFDTTVSLYHWYKQKSFTNNFCLEGVNLFGVLDTAELHNFLIKTICDFLNVKRILEKEMPNKIITNSYLSRLIKPLIINTQIELEVYPDNSKSSLAWDNIEIKFNLGRIPISFQISRFTYNKIKVFLELILGTTLNLWFNNNNKKKTIFLLEFNPSTYKDLLQELANSDKNIVLLNRRRSAIWNFESIKILNQTKCKIINFTKILTTKEKNQIIPIVKKYNRQLDEIWGNDSFSKIFSIENCSFWTCIKDMFVDTYRNRLLEYVNFIFISKKILKQNNVSCITSLNVVGETEKIILDVNNNQIPSIMLEHGFANYVKETTRYDILSMYPLLRDKIAVWGDIQKQYLISQHNIDPKKILVTGSPKHDSSFKIKSSHLSQKIILLTIHPITEISGQTGTSLYIKFENLIKNFCHLVKKFDNVKIIVKLHPGQDLHNDDIKTLFKEIDSTIPVYQLKPIANLLAKCNILVNISPEGFDPSTVILESLIMNKPTMNIILDENFFDFQYVKDNAVVSLSDQSDLEKNLHEILFNDNFRDKLSQNGRNFLATYLINPGNASESFAKILTSY